MMFVSAFSLCDPTTAKSHALPLFHPDLRARAHTHSSCHGTSPKQQPYSRSLAGIIICAAGENLCKAFNYFSSRIRTGGAGGEHRCGRRQDRGRKTRSPLQETPGSRNRPTSSHTPPGRRDAPSGSAIQREPEPAGGPIANGGDTAPDSAGPGRPGRRCRRAPEVVRRSPAQSEALSPPQSGGAAVPRRGRGAASRPRGGGRPGPGSAAGAGSWRRWVRALPPSLSGPRLAGCPAGSPRPCPAAGAALLPRRSAEPAVRRGRAGLRPESGGRASERAGRERARSGERGAGSEQKRRAGRAGLAAGAAGGRSGMRERLCPHGCALPWVVPCQLSSAGPPLPVLLCRCSRHTAALRSALGPFLSLRAREGWMWRITEVERAFGTTLP